MRTRYGFISASNLSGIEKFKILTDIGFELIATDGTKSALEKQSVPATSVEKFTGMPSVMEGRVKTLHPALFGGTLANCDRISHEESLLKVLKGKPIDLVVMNFYPFEREPSLKNIDIGGPAHVRAAAKNHARVTVVVDPHDYDEVIADFVRDGRTPLQTRVRLAGKAFAYTAAYEARIVEWWKGEYGMPQETRSVLATQ